jgi:hypothetical protein
MRQAKVLHALIQKWWRVTTAAMMGGKDSDINTKMRYEYDLHMLNVLITLFTVGDDALCIDLSFSWFSRFSIIEDQKSL